MNFDQPLDSTLEGTPSPGAPAAARPLDSDQSLWILEQIEKNPDVNQVSLANQMDVAVGRINWLIKRLIEKGYVKVKRLQRRKLRYIITPEGIAFRARLTMHYIETSLRLYRRVRADVQDLLAAVVKAGYSQVRMVGDGDIADICRLTCIEHNVQVIADSDENLSEKNLPVLEVNGTRVNLMMEPSNHE